MSDLVVIAKTWIQRNEQFPIDFDEIWELAGYRHRSDAVRAFNACIVNFGMTEGYDQSAFKLTRPNGGIPSQSWKMTVRTAKRFLASAQTKEGFAVIDALIKAEEELQAIKQLSPAEILLQQAQMLVDHERRQKELENSYKDMDARVQTIERDRGGSGFVSILGFCRKHGMDAPISQARAWGVRASSMCRTQQITTGKATHEIYGEVNTYPEYWLEENFDRIFRSSQCN